MSNAMTLGDIIERNAMLHAGKPAVIYQDRPTTYRAFRDRAHALAASFHARGLRRQDRIAILAMNSLAYLEFYAACELAGFIAVPINYRLTTPEILHIVTDAAPSVLVFDIEYAAVAAAIRESGAISTFVCIGDGEATAWAEAFEKLASSSDIHLPFRARPEDIAYIVYTSGTTGRPKGAMLDHAGEIGFIESQTLEIMINPDDRMLLCMPFYHIGAKCNQLGASLRGATVILHRSYDVRAVAETIARERVTVAHLAPVMVQDLLALPDLASFDHSSLKVVQYASGPMAVATVKRGLDLYGQIFMQVYGMTEAGGATVLHCHEHVVDGSPEQLRRLGSAGQAIWGCRVRVIREDETPCEPDELGEILVQTPGLMRGYWNKGGETAAVLRDGWLHTGDIGMLDKDNFLYVVDRKKDMIVSGGENIYPREVEECLYQHPEVAEAAVIGVPDARWGEAVKAFVVLRSRPGPSADEIIEHCRGLIASYKKPKTIEFVLELPRLANKKIDKKKLRAAFWPAANRQI
jgi:acyl-CoA synthetase (AMP-forming)/AMP-acid ligase II